MDNSGHRVSSPILSQREEIEKRMIAKGEMEGDDRFVALCLALHVALLLTSLFLTDARNAGSNNQTQSDLSCTSALHSLRARIQSVGVREDSVEKTWEEEEGEEKEKKEGKKEESRKRK
ncbi:hypothetical protein WUBG_02799 [Wuchereria bancrofti]|uniref:Uncharacterized protein n=1 Tax=Wuchereria bancrofti TaxID=6293 RepID=J9F9P7_WUCBA|nr:hypothetical protein WUBG_02799 [Wuchereria bancrofti]